MLCCAIDKVLDIDNRNGSIVFGLDFDHHLITGEIVFKVCFTS
ncbi:MAG: hypothetical protein ACD_75C01367G0008 [uncultured bacterium]|nr:MAG: hypothetical protein ACD_75C01367G0008 [uncultured bacterium]